MDHTLPPALPSLPLPSIALSSPPLPFDADAFIASSPSTAPSLSSIRRQIRAQRYSLSARVRSILRDASYVNRLQAQVSSTLYPSPSQPSPSVSPHACLPLWVNLRCGAWYAWDPEGSCYFKSTDGHVGTWGFSHSRLNLQTALAAIQHGAIAIVDATKQGKTFPDALTRTIPIWAAVLANVVLGIKPSDCLQMPSWIPESEGHLLKETVIPKLCEKLPESIRAIIRDVLAPVMKRPFRLVWLAPHILDPPCHSCGGAGVEHDDNFGCILKRVAETQKGSAKAMEISESSPTIYLISASRPTPSDDDVHAEHSGWKYIEGAGDDAENWAGGLTPDELWSAVKSLASTHSEVEAGCAEFHELVEVLAPIADAKDVCSISALPNSTFAEKRMVIPDSRISIAISSADVARTDRLIELESMSKDLGDKLAKFHQEKGGFAELRALDTRGCSSSDTMQENVPRVFSSDGNILRLSVAMDKAIQAKCRHLMSETSLPMALRHVQRAASSDQPVIICCEEALLPVAMLFASFLMVLEAPSAIDGDVRNAVRAALARCQCACPAALPPRNLQNEVIKAITAQLSKPLGEL